MMFNATFNNNSAICILWWSVLLVDDPGVPRENHWPATSHWQTLSHYVVSSIPRLSGIWTQNLTIIMSNQFFKISDEKNSPPNEQTVNSHMNLVCFECALVGVVVLLLLTFMLDTLDVLLNAVNLGIFISKYIIDK